jgi:hypothetical protein
MAARTPKLTSEMFADCGAKHAQVDPPAADRGYRSYHTRGALGVWWAGLR